MPLNEAEDTICNECGQEIEVGEDYCDACCSHLDCCVCDEYSDPEEE